MFNGVRFEKTLRGKECPENPKVHNSVSALFWIVYLIIVELLVIVARLRRQTIHSFLAHNWPVIVKSFVLMNILPLIYKSTIKIIQCISQKCILLTLYFIYLMLWNEILLGLLKNLGIVLSSIEGSKQFKACAKKKKWTESSRNKGKKHGRERERVWRKDIELWKGLGQGHTHLKRSRENREGAVIEPHFTYLLTTMFQKKLSY